MPSVIILAEHNFPIASNHRVAELVPIPPLLQHRSRNSKIRHVP